MLKPVFGHCCLGECYADWWMLQDTLTQFERPNQPSSLSSQPWQLKAVKAPVCYWYCRGFAETPRNRFSRDAWKASISSKSSECFATRRSRCCSIATNWWGIVKSDVSSLSSSCRTSPGQAIQFAPFLLENVFLKDNGGMQESINPNADPWAAKSPCDSRHSVTCKSQVVQLRRKKPIAAPTWLKTWLRGLEWRRRNPDSKTSNLTLMVKSFVNSSTALFFSAQRWTSFANNKFQPSCRIRLH